MRTAPTAVARHFSSLHFSTSLNFKSTSSSLSRIKVPTYYGDLPRLIVFTQAHLLIQPSTRFLIQPFAQYNLNDLSSQIREHLPTHSLTPFDPSTIDRDDRHPITQEFAGSSDTINHSQLPSNTNRSQPLFFYRSTSNHIPQAPFLMPILSDAVLLNYHNFLWEIPILSQTTLIRNCWTIRNLCQLDHNNTNIQSLTRHPIPKRTYQIIPASSRRQSTMSATPTRAPNVVINEPSRAVDHLPCTNPLSSDSAMPIPAQPDTNPTLALPVHDFTFTLPMTISPETSTPNSSTPCILPGPDPAFSSSFPPPTSSSPVQLLPTPTHSDSMALLDTTMVFPFTTPSSPSEPIASPPETPSDRITPNINAPPFIFINRLSSYKPRSTRSVL